MLAVLLLVLAWTAHDLGWRRLPPVEALAAGRLLEHPGAVLHHSASPTVLAGRPVGVADIDTWHGSRGFRLFAWGKPYAVAYHFVIRADGVIEAGRPLGTPGGHTADPEFNRYIGICLVGHFDQRDTRGEPQRPAPGQLDSLVRLLRALADRYRFPADRILPHRTVSSTACPGRGLDLAAIRERVGARTPGGGSIASRPAPPRPATAPGEGIAR